MRLNVHIPDVLHATFKDRFPKTNVSALLQGAMAGLLECRHEQLACAACSIEIDHHALVDVALSAFYRDTARALLPLVDRGATAEGAARVVRDIAGRHQITAAAQIPLPRPTRAQRIANKVTDLPTETASRGRHPTARRSA